MNVYRGESVAILRADPDLAELLSPDEREEAEELLYADTISLEPGVWKPGETWTIPA